MSRGDVARSKVEEPLTSQVMCAEQWPKREWKALL